MLYEMGLILVVQTLEVMFGDGGYKGRKYLNLSVRCESRLVGCSNASFVSEAIPDLSMRRWQRRGVNRGMKPKGKDNRRVDPGEGKSGRANVSEPSMRLRY